MLIAPSETRGKISRIETNSEVFEYKLAGIVQPLNGC